MEAQTIWETLAAVQAPEQDNPRAQSAADLAIRCARTYLVDINRNAKTCEIEKPPTFTMTRLLEHNVQQKALRAEDLEQPHLLFEIGGKSGPDNHSERPTWLRESYRRLDRSRGDSLYKSIIWDPLDSGKLFPYSKNQHGAHDDIGVYAFPTQYIVTKGKQFYTKFDFSVWAGFSDPRKTKARCFDFASEPLCNNCLMLRTIYSWTRNVDLEVQYFEHKYYAWTRNVPGIHSEWKIQAMCGVPGERLQIHAALPQHS